MFWCTRLAIEAKNLPELLYSPDMAEHFGYTGNDDISATSSITGYHYIANVPGEIGYEGGPEPGDVVFYRTPAREYYRIAHVAVIHSMENGVMETVHSNAGLKRFPYTIRASDGVVLDNDWSEVVGFGKK